MIFLVSGLVLFAYAAIYKPEDIPTVEPSDYKNFADHILNDDGTIEEVSSGNIYTYYQSRWRPLVYLHHGRW